MKPGDGVSLRRSAMCAAVGVAMTLGSLAANAVSASPVAVRPGAARVPQPTARWRLPHFASQPDSNAGQSAGIARWRLSYTASRGSALSLTAVTALNPHNAWAVGSAANDYVHDHAVALHWIDGRWRNVPIPDAHLFFPEYVAASSPHDVWILGSRVTSTGQPWQAIRWNGRSWLQVPQPPVPGVVNEVPFVVLGPSNVWFSGQGSCTAAGCSTPVCWWNGQSWTVYNLKGTVTSLAASSPANIWAAGFHVVRRITRPLAYRWTGAAWRAVPLPRRAVTGSENGDPVIDTSSPRAVWIGSQGNNPSGLSYLLHWNGHRWGELRTGFPGGTAVIDWPIGIWTTPWTIFNGRNFGELPIPSWMNRVNYLARVPHSDAMLAVGGKIGRTAFRTEIFAYGRFG